MTSRELILQMNMKLLEEKNKKVLRTPLCERMHYTEGVKYKDAMNVYVGRSV